MGTTAFITESAHIAYSDALSPPHPHIRRPFFACTTTGRPTLGLWTDSIRRSPRSGLASPCRGARPRHRTQNTIQSFHRSDHHCHLGHHLRPSGKARQPRWRRTGPTSTATLNPVVSPAPESRPLALSAATGGRHPFCVASKVATVIITVQPWRVATIRCACEDDPGGC